MPDFEQSLKQLADRNLARQQQANGQAKLTAIAYEEQAMVLQLANGSIQACNPIAERILGLTAEQLIGRNWLDLPCKAICEDGSPFSDATHPAMVALHTGKACLNVVMGLDRPHGQLVWLLVNSQPLFLPGENTPYAVVTTFAEITALANLAEDITEQRRTEFALRQSYERFELAAAAVNCLIYDWDIQNDTLERTQGLTELLGYTLAETEPTSKWWRSRIYPGDLQKAHDDFTASLAKGNRFCTQYRVRHKDGHYVWVEDRGLAVRDENDRLVRVVGVTADISDRKQVEANLRESEERIRLATAAAELGMWFWNLTTNKLVWTPKCKQLFGLPANTEMSYELFLNCLHPDDRQRIHEAVTSTLERNVDYDVECRTIWPDGSVHWIAAKGRCLYDMAGKPVRMMGTAQDITQRKQTEEELRQSEERYRTLAEAIPEMVWTTNAQGLADYVNQRWIDYTGLTLEETIGYGWQKVLHPDDLEVIIQRWRKSVRTGTVYECEQRFRRACDGTYYWHLVRAYPLKDNQGHVVKWFGTCTDIHDQKQIEAQRAQLLEREKAARAEAEAANRIKDQFLAILSHELRSPLNPILGWTKLLKSRKLDPAATGRALDTIERNAKLQIQLIDDLLDVSRILRDKLSLNNAAVDLTSVIDAALETVRLAAQTKKIQLEYLPSPPSPHPPIPPSSYIVWGDFNRLQQVVSNILSNAVKFTSEGGKVEVRLEVVKDVEIGRWGTRGPHDRQGVGIREDSAVGGFPDLGQLSVGNGENIKSDAPHHPTTPPPHHKNHYAQITVTDTGIGIRSEFLPYVFEYFRQADSSTTRKFGGLGLGLAIVHHLVELHGGIVTADSPGEGQGATFTVTLPLMKNTEGEEERGKEGEDTPSSLAGLRILIVDDDTDTRDFLCYFLKEYGATVTVAASASEALAVLAQSQHDLLISDVGMPEIDGYSLIHQIRAMSPERGGNIPAIALTAYAGNNDRSRVLAAGFQIHIAKPLDTEQLLMAIADLSRKRG